jgi:3'(2'), 5'-bisphosphate nucleotidase
MGSVARFWTLDPIDGTKGYLRGQQYAISLALVMNGQVSLGALCCPNFWPEGSSAGRGAVFFAVKGEGANVCCLDQAGEAQQVKVSDTAEPAAATFCESFEPEHTSHSIGAKVREILRTTAPPVRVDSQAKYALVATGLADVYLRTPTIQGYEEKIWDHAAGALVLAEAGGRVTDLTGRTLEFNHGRTLSNNCGVLATNGRLHEQLLQAIHQAREGTAG